MNTAPRIVHETRTRLRLLLPAGANVAAVSAAVRAEPGVASVRAVDRLRSIAIEHDGRATTRAALLDVLASSTATGPAVDLDHDGDRGESSARPRFQAVAAPSVEVPAVAAALAPLLPPVARTALALGLVGERVWRESRRGADPTAVTLDAIALASTALTGHPFTTTVSLLLSALAEQRRDTVLARTDALFQHLVPASGTTWRIERSCSELSVSSEELAVGDLLWLTPNDVLPADALVVEGNGTVVDSIVDRESNESAKPGTRLCSGRTMTSGRLRIRVERPSSQSLAARMRDHVRHVTRTREQPGVLTPDLERLVALPVTAAGLVLSLTGDTQRTAAMLQADPQLGISLAQPVAREAALYAAARCGALMSSLDALEKLATATSFAFEDVGVLADAYWQLEKIELHSPGVDDAEVRGWIATLAGAGDALLLDAGLADDKVTAWREHGALLNVGRRQLHLGGAALIATTWGIRLAEPDRRSLVRRLGIVEGGRLLATAHLACRLRPDVATRFRELRALGVTRIALFTEDPAAEPAAALRSAGADVIVCESRAAQEQWLEVEAERGARVALVHTGMRNLLPPGGLSLCPASAAAGADGVLLGEPLQALVAARTAAMDLRRRLRERFGRSVALNATLLVATAMRWSPPLLTSVIKHGLAFLLIEESARLADARVSEDVRFNNARSDS